MQIQELQLQSLLNREIPISREMGVQILTVADMELLMKLPLSPNKNHKNTLFGGSLYSACALACYGLFLAGLRAQGVNTQNIVIGDGQIKYLLPVTKDSTVQSRWPSVEEKSDFFNQLAQKRKARITMKAVILLDGNVACEFTGRFIAKRDS